MTPTACSLVLVKMGVNLSLSLSLSFKLYTVPSELAKLHVAKLTTGGLA